MRRTHGAVAIMAWAGLLALSHSAGAAVADREASHVGVAPIPLSFERNLGQAPEDVRYLSHGKAGAIALSAEGLTLSLTSPGASADVIHLQVQGSAAKISPIAEAPLPGRVNYLIGNDPTKWLTQLKTYGKVRYRGVYPGVDLVYYGTDGKLEYDFAVAPHANAKTIGLTFAGADGLRVDSHGVLEIKKGAHQVVFERPVAYQVVAGRRVRVAADYAIDGATVRFQLGAYDSSWALIIDPVLSYFSYLGGSNVDVIGKTPPQVGSVSGQAAAVDSSGDLLVAGYTLSADFPTQAPFAPATAKTSGNTWAFVSKFAPDGKSLIYSTYMGGTNGNDYGYGIAVDANGNAFVAGQSGSTDFPTTSGAYLRICSPTYTNSPNNPFSGCGNGNYESFIAKLSATGTLVASTYLGGTHTLSGATAVAVDSNGRPYVAGTTLPGENIPAGISGYNQAVGFQTTAGAVVAPYNYIANVPINGALQYDAYVSVFDPTLATLLYSTLIGDDRPQDGTVQFTSQANTLGTSVAVDASGNFYLAGYTADAYLPTTSGSVQSAASTCGAFTAGTPHSLGGNCGIVAKFSPVGGTNGPTLVYATYLGSQAAAGGSSWEDEITGIVADATGAAYVVGYSNQAGFPTTTGAYQTTCNGYNNATNTGNYDCNAAFIAKLNPTGSQLLSGSYFGCITCSGDAVSTVGAIALDAQNNVYIAGFGGNGLPVVNGFASNNSTGGQAPFVAEFDPTLAMLKFSTFVNVGNAGQISPGGLALDSSGNIYVAGSVNGPSSSAATAGAFQTSYGGGSSDGFVAKITVTQATATKLSIAPTSATTGTAVTFTATVAETSSTGMPTGSVTFSNGGTQLGSGTLNGSGVATYTTSALAAGSYSVTAAYGGDANNNASMSSVVALTITPPPPAPTATISVSPTTITQGASATLTWSSTNATACTASGSWTGSEATSGTMSVTPATTGALSYALACTGAGGTANATATLTVNAQSSGGSGGSGGGASTGSKGGGGSCDLLTLFGLALLLFGRGPLGRAWMRFV